jgi:hypothetical protein
MSGYRRRTTRRGRQVARRSATEPHPRSGWCAMAQIQRNGRWTSYPLSSLSRGANEVFEGWGCCHQHRSGGTMMRRQARPDQASRRARSRPGRFAPRRVGVADYSTTPLTEPDVRTRIRLLGSISECQRELVGGPWGVEFAPACFERNHPLAKPGGRVGLRHARPVRFRPTPLAAVRRSRGRLLADLAGKQMPIEEARSLLLAHDDRPEPTANMGIDNPKFGRRFRRAKPVVRHPPIQVAADIRHAGSNRPAPVGRRHLPYGVHHRPLRLIGQRDPRLIPSDA